MTNTELAWAAGLFDGEGCVHLSNDGYYNLILTVKMTHEETIKTFQKIFKLGNVTSFAAKGKRKGGLSFDAHGEEVIKIIEAIAPYLVTKKEHADLVLEYRDKGLFLKQRKVGESIPDKILIRRSFIYEDLKSLNKRGI